MNGLGPNDYRCGECGKPVIGFCHCNEPYCEDHNGTLDDGSGIVQMVCEEHDGMRMGEVY